MIMIKIYPSKLCGPISTEIAIQHGKLLEKVFSVKDTGIDSKIFHTWKMANILDTVPKKKWAELSFIEFLWLRTLETMRKFGCSHKLMKDIHSHLFIRAYEENLFLNTLKENIKFLTSLSASRPLSSNESEFLEDSKAILNDPIIISTTNFEITYFYQLVLKCFINNTEVGIIIFEDGTFSTYELSSNPKSKSTIDLSKPHLLIPINYFIKNFIANEEKEQFLTKCGLLTEQEYEVIKQIRNKNVKRITITFKDDNRQIEKIEPEISGIIKGEDAKRIMQSLGLKNYSGIELHTRDGNTLSFTQTSKIYMT
jgi:hypothetical protein